MLLLVVPVLATASIPPAWGTPILEAVPPVFRTLASIRFMICAVSGLIAWVVLIYLVLSSTVLPR